MAFGLVVETPAEDDSLSQRLEHRQSLGDEVADCSDIKDNSFFSDLPPLAMQSVAWNVVSSLSSFATAELTGAFVLSCAVRYSLMFGASVRGTGDGISLLGNPCVVPLVHLYLWELRLWCQAGILRL